MVKIKGDSPIVDTPTKGKEGKGHKRVYEGTDYAELRKKLKID